MNSVFFVSRLRNISLFSDIPETANFHQSTSFLIFKRKAKRNNMFLLFDEILYHRISFI
jgi:hypothetical protein